MIEELNYTSPLGNSDHCSLEFILKCYCEEKSCKTERWNYFKGDYTNMNTFLQCDWNDILKVKNAGQQFDIFMTKFNEAKNKYISHMNTKAFCFSDCAFNLISCFGVFLVLFFVPSFSVSSPTSMFLFKSSVRF
jgi:hypothetical protein